MVIVTFIHPTSCCFSPTKNEGWFAGQTHGRDMSTSRWIQNPCPDGLIGSALLHPHKKEADDDDKDDEDGTVSLLDTRCGVVGTSTMHGRGRFGEGSTSPTRPTDKDHKRRVNEPKRWRVRNL